MEFYKRLIIKILERTTVGENNHLLVKLKSGHDLTQKERAELEELFDSVKDFRMENSYNKSCK